MRFVRFLLPLPLGLLLAACPEEDEPAPKVAIVAAVDAAAEAKADAADACTGLGDLDIGGKCPTGCIVYTPGGPDGGRDVDAGSGRFICGDYTTLLRACMARHFPGVKTWSVRGECIRDGHVRDGHSVTVMLDPCTGQLCAVHGDQVGAPNGSGPCCWTPPAGSPPDPSSMPPSCTGFPGDVIGSPPSAGNIFRCEPPDQLGQVEGVHPEPEYCDYGPGNEFWQCNATCERVSGEFGCDVRTFFDASTTTDAAVVADAAPVTDGAVDVQDATAKPDATRSDDASAAADVSLDVSVQPPTPTP